jgi:hypothetical protein
VFANNRAIRSLDSTDASGVGGAIWANAARTTIDNFVFENNA